MTVDRLALRCETRVRTFAELPLERAGELKKTFYDVHAALPSVRPVLMLTGALPWDPVEAQIRRCHRKGQDVLTASLSTAPTEDLAELRRRTEDALVLARALAHHCAGKTVEVWAYGSDVAPAALMMALERPYFSVLTAVEPPPARSGWPTWEEMAK